MKETHTYLVPDYYPDFQCKMGACRTPCCEGWPISLSMQDYFHLLGVDCSPELRRRIDCSLHLAERPTEEAYARIDPRYDGVCPMHMQDGRCAIHAELGDASLSYVCRLYPRGVRTEGDFECSCANSCEATLETMFRRKEPLNFRTMELTMDIPKTSARTVFFETVGREQEIRLYFIRKLQQRDQTMPERICSLGFALKEMEEALNRQDEARVQALLNGEPTQISDDLPEVTRAHLEHGLEIAKRMLEILDAHSDSIREYGEASLKVFDDAKQGFERYLAARKHFENVISDWESDFEHMLVNHMFFSRFPFQDRPESMYDEFIAICAVYTLLRFLSLGWMANQQDEAAFVDVCAAAFRLIDHTAFDRYASHLLRDLGCSAPNQLLELLLL